MYYHGLYVVTTAGIRGLILKQPEGFLWLGLWNFQQSSAFSLFQSNSTLLPWTSLDPASNPSSLQLDWRELGLTPEKILKWQRLLLLVDLELCCNTSPQMMDLGLHSLPPVFADAISSTVFPSWRSLANFSEKWSSWGWDTLPSTAHLLWVTITLAGLLRGLLLPDTHTRQSESESGGQTFSL